MDDDERISDEFREHIQPEVFPPIERTFLAKVLRRIETTNVPLGGIVPLVAEAGAGKSVLLTQVYDSVKDDAFVRFLELSRLTVDVSHADADLLDRALGSILGLDETRLSYLTSSPKEDSKPSIILIDTVDLVITATNANSFVSLVTKLKRTGTTVLFTCRGYEFETFLRSLLVRPDESASHVVLKVPPLDEREIFLFTRAYFRKEGYTGEVAFAQNLLHLAQSVWALGQMISNPLHLAMLCAVFGDQKEHVPFGLTAGGLYERFWSRKVAKSRRHPNLGASTSLAKQRLCLGIAERLWDLSLVSLVDRTSLTDVPIAATYPDALHDLVSENVIWLESGQGLTRVGFLHQTFTEYVMAMWLAQPDQLAKRDLIILDLRSDPHRRAHWWPVVGYLLYQIAQSQPVEYQRIVRNLDLSQLIAFRTVAFSAGASGFSDVLSELADLAMKLGPIYQEHFAEALATTSNEASSEGMRLAIRILQSGPDREVARTSAKAIASLLLRTEAMNTFRLGGVLESLADVRATSEESHLAQLIIDLTTPLLAVGTSFSHADLLMLREWLPFVDTRGVDRIIVIHQAPGVSGAERAGLSRILLEKIGPKMGPREEMLDFLLATIPWAKHSDNDSTGHSSFDEEALRFLVRSPVSERKFRYSLVAQLAVRRPSLAEKLIAEMFTTTTPGRREMYQLALQEASVRGAADEIAERLLQRELDGAQPLEVLRAVKALIQSLAPHTQASTTIRLARWTESALRDYPEALIEGYVLLAVVDEAVMDQAFELMSSVWDADRQRRLLANMLAKMSADVASARLEQIEAKLIQLGAQAKDKKDIEQVLTRLYGVASANSKVAQQKLLVMALSRNVSTSRQACVFLTKSGEAKESWLLAEDLLPLLASGDENTVRTALIVGKELIMRGSGNVDAFVGASLRELGLVATHVQQEVFSVAHAYLRDGRGNEAGIVEDIGCHIGRSLGQPVEPGVARELLALIKTCAYQPPELLKSSLAPWYRSALSNRSLTAVKNGVEWLTEIGRRALMLGLLQGSDLASLALGLPEVGQKVVLRALVDFVAFGANSVEFGTIFQGTQFEGVRADILRMRDKLN